MNPKGELSKRESSERKSQVVTLVFMKKKEEKRIGYFKPKDFYDDWN